MKTLLRAASLITAIVAIASPIQAQWAGVKTPGVPRNADGQPNLTAPAPKTVTPVIGFTIMGSMSARHLGLLVLGVVAVSFSAILVREADAPALTVAFYRNAMAAVVLVPLAFARHREEIRSLRRKQIAPREITRPTIVGKV